MMARHSRRRVAWGLRALEAWAVLEAWAARAVAAVSWAVSGGWAVRAVRAARAAWAAWAARVAQEELAGRAARRRPAGRVCRVPRGMVRAARAVAPVKAAHDFSPDLLWLADCARVGLRQRGAYTE